MFISRFLKYRLAICGLAATAVFGGCSDLDMEVPSLEEETPFIVETDIAVSLGTDWEVDTDATRSAPPGFGENNNTSSGSNANASDHDISGLDEIEGVDQVRIITFRRRELSNDSFVYDAMNDITADVKAEDVGVDHTEPNNNGTHIALNKRYVARAKLKKVAGFEYKLIAVAYESSKQSSFPKVDRKNSKFDLATFKGDADRLIFNIGDGVKYDDFKADIYTASVGTSANDWNQLYDGNQITTAWLDSYEKNCKHLSRKAIEVPQLFFGECRTVSGKDIISFTEDKDDPSDPDKIISDPQVPITGVLYRGVAKVELRITPKKHKINSLDESMDWLCLMASDIRNAVYLRTYDDFLPTNSVDDANIGELNTPIVYQSLSSEKQITLSAYLLPGKAKLSVRAKYQYGLTPYVYNGWLSPGNSDEDHYGNGTGIVSPEVNDGYFYLRRNHKYVINVSDSEIIFKSGNTFE